MIFTDSLKYDLHTHSNFSDGTLSPSELVLYAKEQNIDVLALADHDSINGLSEAKLACAQNNIHFVTGVELSVTCEYGNIHILGLNFDMDDTKLNQILNKQQEIREKRALDISKYLESYNIFNAYDNIKQKISNQITRAHYANYLIEIGKVSTKKQAFKKYLSNYHINKLSTNWINLEQAVTTIKDAGGVTIIAHPYAYDLSKTKLHLLYQQFKKLGGDGLELAINLKLPNQIEKLVKNANQYEFAVSIGSDFHYPTTWSKLGSTIVPNNSIKIWELFR